MCAGPIRNVYPPMSEFLVAEGIRTMAGFSEDHITPDVDLVVVGNTISRGNPELEAVLERKIRHCSLPEAIRDQFLWGSRSIVLAGTHGKTTTDVVDRLVVDAWPARPNSAGGRDCPELRGSRLELPAGRRP